jgi:hypothetical protein
VSGDRHDPTDLSPPAYNECTLFPAAEGDAMPLLDHFHPPLTPRRKWESFHSQWAASLAAYLNRDKLPPRYYAEMQVHVGGRIEIDVATMESPPNGPTPAPAAVATAVLAPAAVWAPPEPLLAMPAVFPDEFEVLVYVEEGGLNLVAAVELVSPGNKDRDESRRAFAAKCASYLHQGVGLVIVDVVTERRANLHDELIRLMGRPESFTFPGDSPLYVVAYRPARRKKGDQIDIWPTPLAVGQPLPTVPLALRGAGCVPLDLESTYTEARQRSRLD